MALGGKLIGGLAAATVSLTTGCGTIQERADQVMVHPEVAERIQEINGDYNILKLLAESQAGPDELLKQAWFTEAEINKTLMPNLLMNTKEECRNFTNINPFSAEKNISISQKELSQAMKNCAQIGEPIDPKEIIN